ncbi:MAG: F0F1 ATP synthase subunit C [Candidatus Thalassarchaeaceae archaeon]|jgi:V/A-type H+-transporting ATPase subunit K|tara:strand:- start:1996 stop:2310 length:315 start_codon:yes stop_codon:yes gene_type:complete
MNRRNMMKGMSTLMVLTSFAMIASVVAAQEGDVETAAAHWDAQKLGAGLALGLCGIGTGMSQGPIGAAAVGMISEDSSKFVSGLIFTALPETIVLFGFLALFLL